MQKDLLVTPRHRWTIIFLTVILLIAGPFASTYYFEETQRRGYYSPDADSIGIAIFSYYFAWLVFAPLVLTIASTVTKNYRSVSIFIWSRRKVVVAVLYTAIALLFTLFKILLCIENATDGLPFNAIYDTGWIVLILWLRAAAVSKLSPTSEWQIVPECSCGEVGYFRGRKAESRTLLLNTLHTDSEKRRALLRCPVCGHYWELSNLDCNGDLILAQVTPTHAAGEWNIDINSQIQN